MPRIGLQNTAALLRKTGWHQGSSRGTNGICVSYALVISSPNHAIREEDRKALAKHVGIDPRQIPKWNDAPGRTFAEVLEALEQA